MRIHFILGLVWLTVAFNPSQAAQENNQPRVSATDTSYLSCTVWNGHEWTKPTARSARTPVIQSPKGMRAYAEVKVAIENGACENSTTLHIAHGVGGRFKSVYTKTRGGNGIHLRGWSPSGDELLGEVNLWEYKTDRGYDHGAVVYDAASDSAKEIPELNHALLQHFGPDCEFEHEIQGWKNNEQILVKVSKSAEDDSYEQHFCVERPRLYVFDLQTKALQFYQRQTPKKR